MEKQLLTLYAVFTHQNVLNMLLLWCLPTTSSHLNASLPKEVYDILLLINIQFYTQLLQFLGVVLRLFISFFIHQAVLKALKCLQLIQNTEVRALTENKRSYFPHDSFFFPHRLPVRFTIELKMLLLTYKGSYYPNGIWI